MGEVAVACASGYMEFRDVIPDWRDTLAELVSWYTDILKRQSFVRSSPD